MKIAVFGAGSTGCYLGAQLTMGGLDTTLICRDYIKDKILKNSGITITDYLGNRNLAMPQALITEIEKQQFDVVFVTLKCHHLPTAIEDIRRMTTPESHIIFMQNGIGSLSLIEQHLKDRKHALGITQFNVLQMDNAVFHKGTEGDFIVAANPATEVIQKHLNNSGFEMSLEKDMQPVVFGKLIMNLNNALNTIADMPIQQQLKNRRLRKILAAAMREWLAVCSAMQVELKQLAAVKPAVLPKILSLPNWLFNLVAKKMLDIDPLARSSMWEDIQAKRKTEIEYLNGAVVDLGKKHQIQTPINALITQQIKHLEQGQQVQLEDLFQ
ncbi:2-dehydropantoate 2-reductase [Marinicella sp. W31]|uniref:2-dehydropantoate 2-reductase n=1 Tax=Marinicella sp. W31 TaxID=3023713 RepID=UPI0037571455